MTDAQLQAEVDDSYLKRRLVIRFGRPPPSPVVCSFMSQTCGRMRARSCPGLSAVGLPRIDQARSLPSPHDAQFRVGFLFEARQSRRYKLISC